MIKLIVTDIDDTLLNTDEKISQKTKETIKKCIEKGIMVILASGRPDFGMIQFVNDLGLNQYENYLLSYNGAKLTNLQTNEVVYDQMLDVNRLKFLVDKSEENGVSILTYQDNKVLTNSPNPYAFWEAKALKTNLFIKSSIKEEITQKAPKVIMLAEPSYAQMIKEKLAKEISDEYEVAMSKPFFIEINDKGISKGVALDYLCQQLKVDRNEVLALGDGLNDVSMIEYAGIGVAMGNANDKLKAVADYVTKTNDEDGWSYAVEKFALSPYQ